RRSARRRRRWAPRRWRWPRAPLTAAKQRRPCHPAGAAFLYARAALSGRDRFLQALRILGIDDLRRHLVGEAGAAERGHVTLAVLHAAVGAERAQPAAAGKPERSLQIAAFFSQRGAGLGDDLGRHALGVQFL